MKRLAVTFFLCCSLALCGCWDYQSLDEMTLVAGLAIDESESKEDPIELTLEIIDLPNANADDQVPSATLGVSGSSLSEALSEAGIKMWPNLYLGNTETLVISKAYAENTGIKDLIDPLIRDKKVRDNLAILISKDDKASELFEYEEDIVSYALNNVLATTENYANITHSARLYTVMRLLSDKMTSLVLPIVTMLDAKEGRYEFDGLALFKDDKIIGTMSQEDVFYFNLAVCKIERGMFTVHGDDGCTAVVSIRRSHPKHKVEIEDGKAKLTIDVNVSSCSLLEYKPNSDTIDSAKIALVEGYAKKHLEQEIKEVIEGIHKEYGIDIIGFNDHLRDTDPDKWQEVKDNWEEILKNAELDVNIKVHIDDSGLTI
jgi:spore germination protein KC